MLVERWDDAVQCTINPDHVVEVAPHVDDTVWHCHVAFGRAEAWDLKFADSETLTVNGCPRGLEHRVPAEHHGLLSHEQLACIR